jgi:flagellar hook-associated protein 1 FlgK
MVGSEFAAIGVGLGGMEAAREELDVTGNNIANANSPGYVRETVDLASEPAPTPTLLMPGGGAGQGVVILGTTRLTDATADAQDLSAQGSAGAANETQSLLSQAQAALNEPGSSGISSQLASFWSQWDAVANNPTDQGARTTLLANASTLATSFNQTAAALDQVRSSATGGAEADVAQVNQLAAQVATLNSEVVTAQAGGSDAAGLADQRSNVVNQLAQLLGVSTRAESNGALDVLVGSELLVQGTNAATVTGTADPSTGTLTLTWPDSSTVAAGGQLGALVQAVNTTLPGYLSQLDNAAMALENTVNTQQAAGVTWTGVGTPAQASAPGQALFSGTGAASLAVAPGMTAAGIAAGSPSAGPADGSNAQAMAELGNAATGADALYRGFVGLVGTDVSTASSQASATTTIQAQADAQRQSSEGVNLDEELANMTQFQIAYSASAKYLSTVDQTIQDLLSMVG